jgi:hypothetical protein
MFSLFWNAYYEWKFDGEDYRCLCTVWLFLYHSPTLLVSYVFLLLQMLHHMPRQKNHRSYMLHHPLHIIVLLISNTLACIWDLFAWY